MCVRASEYTDQPSVPSPTGPSIFHFFAPASPESAGSFRGGWDLLQCDLWLLLIGLCLPCAVYGPSSVAASLRALGSSQLVAPSAFHPDVSPSSFCLVRARAPVPSPPPSRPWSGSGRPHVCYPLPVVRRALMCRARPPPPFSSRFPCPVLTMSLPHRQGRHLHKHIT